MDARKIDLMLKMIPEVSRRDFLRTATAGAAAAGALATPKRARAQTPKKGGTLVYGMEGPSDILDPQATGCAGFRWVGATELSRYEFPAADARLLGLLRQTPILWQ